MSGNRKPPTSALETIRFLMAETGITAAEAEDLVRMLGANRNSLLREARILQGQKLAKK